VGLSTLKALREDGFRVAGFERRERVGGLWAYTDDPSMTSALKSTSTTTQVNRTFDS
jgi:dimethylaniline monooxygenase (N-oxide forming)